jgi:hypothetical protein
MHKLQMAAIAACLSVAPVFAGALVLEVGSPAGNPEATAKSAVVVARVTACKSPEKSSVTATAEGVVHGKRQSIPLKVIYLATPGTFAVAREWPKEGTWAVKMVLTNPDYKDYSSAVLVPIRNDAFSTGAVKHIYHPPTPEEIDSVLAQNSI